MIKEFKEEFFCSLCEFWSFCRRNRNALLAVAFFAVLTYGYELTHFTLGSDEEIEIMYNHYNMRMIGLGRFFYTLLDEFMHGLGRFTPFVDTFLSVTFLFLSAIMLLFIFDRFYKKTSFSQIALFSGLFFAVPFYSSAVISISGYNSIITFATLLTAISVYLAISFVRTNNYCHFFSSSIVLALAIGCYQSYLFAYITVVLLCVLLDCCVNTIEIKKLFIQILKYIIICFFGFLLYNTFNSLIQLLFGISASYTSQFWGWGGGDIFEVFKGAFLYCVFLIKLDRNFGGIPVYFFLLILFFVSLCFTIKFKNMQSLLITVVGGFACISPFFMPLLLGSAIPIRAFQSLPIVVGFSVYLLLILVNKIPPIKSLVVILAVVAVLLQAQATTRILFGDHQRYIADINTAALIDHDILSEIKASDDVAVVFVGGISQKYTPLISQLDVMGVSFFALDGGRNLRIHAFMRTLGYVYKDPTIEQMKLAADVVDGMPNWPSRESITLLDDLCIVKLGEPDENWKKANLQ